ncbi:9854_t:CDS:2 [Acaulospora morrowiae]|uniref:9854_t:CDS:1 n=1 Tax=Acaulospora morrowiae TaxID=94023 RepID=A0A9N9DHD3_9GLOM|nr:9854_t:CDS:2 [Acaulospora morrowiae]
MNPLDNPLSENDQIASSSLAKQQQNSEKMKNKLFDKAPLEENTLGVTSTQDNNNSEKSKKDTSMKHKLFKFSSDFKKFIGFIGPGYVIAVGYLDPGNWATDLSAGSRFGYSLLFVIFCSNLMAMLLQSLSVKLGVVTGMDLAQACRAYYSKYVNYFLYVLCELAIIACDLAEVIGSAIALNLLIDIPLPWGVAITAVDVIIILFLYRDNDMKSAHILESLVMLLVGAVGLCFVLELVYAKPNSVDVLKGYLPSAGIFTNREELYIAVSIVGATVMPHCIYLHSHLVKARKFREESREIKCHKHIGFLENGDTLKDFFKRITQSTIYFSVVDSIVALTFALFVNSAILIVSAANFYYVSSQPLVAGLYDAYNLLTSYLGRAASTIFAIALLFAGQSSTLTATIAGQIVMEGFTDMKLKPWVRRLVTRLIAIVPAMIIVIWKGASGLNDLLVGSQVALSIQLPFAVVPLVWFTSRKEFMRVDVRELIKRELQGEEVMNDAEGIENQLGEKTITNKKLSGPFYSDLLSQKSTPNSSKNDDISDDKRYIEFSNSYLLIITACIVSFTIISLDLYLVIDIIIGAVRG